MERFILRFRGSVVPRTGSVNVLSGAPFGYRSVRKTDLAGACYEISQGQAALVAELFAATPTRAPPSPTWPAGSRLRACPPRTGKHRWDRSVVWGMPRNPAYAGTAAFGKTMAIHEPAGLNRVAASKGAALRRPSRR
jgi:site-specific DNA recombinase